MLPRLLFRAAAITAAMTCALLLHAEPARADAASEAYVQSNASGAMAALNQAGSAAERSTKFGTLMEQFADMSVIATDVLPRAQKQQLAADTRLKADWIAAFRDYAMATYEDQLDRYRGASLKVTGSRDSVANGKTKSRVRTEMTQKKGQPLVVYWYLEKHASADGWRVADVGLGSGDSEIKLAIMQRDQFAAMLQQNGGDMRKLINQLRTQTAAMRTRIASKKNA